MTWAPSNVGFVAHDYTIRHYDAMGRPARAGDAGAVSRFASACERSYRGTAKPLASARGLRKCGECLTRNEDDPDHVQPSVDNITGDVAS